MTDLIIHGHFYQPPRENPWTGRVEREPSASPYHDWNERIHAECYAPNAQAHIIGAQNKIERTINNYERISFNFGPTLMSWLVLHHPATYNRILEADRASISLRGGHGNAIAQAYGHAILPLCNERDRLTQVLWGIADFRHRFGREPESLWVPETACNNATLDLLIDQELRFVILAPHQLGRYKLPGSEQWQEIQNRRPPTAGAYRYLHQDGSGRSIAVFFYNDLLSRAIAFEKVLGSSEALVNSFKQAAATGSPVSVATDGETYGHHFKFGDLCLAHALEIEAPAAGFRVTNFGEYLDRHPAEIQVEINHGSSGEGTSWSCTHGVGRWMSNCGCHLGAEPGWTQTWRGPLRAALNFLRDRAAAEYEDAGGDLFRNPWDARNGYIELILESLRSSKNFFERYAKRLLSTGEQDRARALLEMQRHSLLTFTSCGWFFSDVSGIETLQVMKYAARVIESMEQLGFGSPRDKFLEMLSEARSNRSELGTAADIYRKSIEPLAFTQTL